MVIGPPARIAKRCQTIGARPIPRDAAALQRVEIAQAEIRGQCLDDTLVGRTVPPRHTHERDQSVCQHLALGHFTEPMQAATDLGLFQVADIGVEPVEDNLITAVIAGDLLGDMAAPGQGQNLVA